MRLLRYLLPLALVAATAAAQTRALQIYPFQHRTTSGHPPSTYHLRGGNPGASNATHVIQVDPFRNIITSMNNQGEAVGIGGANGFRVSPEATGYSVTFIAWPVPDGLGDLVPAAYTQPYGISNDQRIVGTFGFNSNDQHCFLTVGGKYKQIDIGAVGTACYGIASDGTIFGSYTNDGNTVLGFSRRYAGYTTYHYPGASDTIVTGFYHEKAYGIYIGGDCTAIFSGCAFVYDGSHYTQIPVPASSGGCGWDHISVNDDGLVSGSINEDCVSGDFFLDQGVIADGQGNFSVYPFPGYADGGSFLMGVNHEGVKYGQIQYFNLAPYYTTAGAMSRK